jgi:hypothetical protein
MARGQTSLEFLFLIAFMFVIFVAFFIVIQERTVDVARQRDLQTMKEVNNLVKYEVKNAQFFDDGYIRNFNLPILVNGRMYNASISSDQYEAGYNLSGVEYLDFFDQPVQGNISRGMNTICKKQGRVHLNNCSGILY